MFRKLLGGCVALLLPVAVLQAAPIPAGLNGKDIIDLPVSANSMLVIQFNGIEPTRDRILKTIEGVDRGDDTPKLAASWKREFEGFYKFVLDKHDLSSVDPKARIFITVESFDGLTSAEPPVALFLPVTNYKAFQKTFLSAGERKSLRIGRDGVDEFERSDNDQTLYLVDTQVGYVVLNSNKAVATSYTGKYDRLTAKALGSLAESLFNADVSLYLNIARISEAYALQIAQAKQFLPFLFQQAKNTLTPSQLESAKFLLEGLLLSFEHTEGFALMLEARAEGANLRTQVTIKTGSATARVLAENAPSHLNALLELPKGSNSSSASKLGVALAGVGRATMPELQAAEGDEQTAKVVAAYLALLDEAVETVSYTKPEFASLSASSYKDSDAFAAAKLKAFQSTGRGTFFGNLVLKDPAKVNASAEKHAGFTLHSATIKVDFEASVPAKADETARDAAIETMKQFQPETQTLWFGSDGKRFVQITAKDWPAAKGLLEEFTKPTAKSSADAEFMTVRKQLPEAASAISIQNMDDVVKLLAVTVNSLGSAVPFPGLEIPKLETKAIGIRYFGYALTAKPQSVQFDLFLPSQAIGQVARSLKIVHEKE